MTEEAKAARAEYKRKWRLAHPDKVKEYNRRYWEKKSHPPVPVPSYLEKMCAEEAGEANK